MVLIDVKKQETSTQATKHSSDYFIVAVKPSGDISAKPARGQKIEEHVAVLDLPTDENRPTSQQCSSRRTSRCIIERHDRWDGWRHHWRQRYRSLCPLASQYTGKMQEYWLKYETGPSWHCDKKSFFKNDVPQHRKDRNLSQKCATCLIRRQNHNGELLDRSWLRFSPSQTCVKCWTCGLMCPEPRIRLNVRILDWKHALEGLRSHEHPMEHIDATITFSRKCNESLYEKLIGLQN